MTVDTHFIVCTGTGDGLKQAAAAVHTHPGSASGWQTLALAAAARAATSCDALERTDMLQYATALHDTFFCGEQLVGGHGAAEASRTDSAAVAALLKAARAAAAAGDSDSDSDSGNAAADKRAQREELEWQELGVRQILYCRY